MKRAERWARDVARRITALNGFVLLIFSIVGSAIWTSLGLWTSHASANPYTFLRDWFLLQGPPLICVGFFLLPFTRSRRLEKLAADIGCPERISKIPARWQITICTVVTVLGTASLISLGFPARGLTLSFMWITCFLICFMASFATLHALAVLKFASQLPSCSMNLHPYSPADTPGIRKLAEYIAFFGFVVSIGYVFAFTGTVSGNWVATSPMVRAVQFFWPIIYVPLCLTTLLYPHIAIHSIIRNEKDRTIMGLQAKITDLVAVEENLSNEEIDRLNSLADLIQKIESTPNFPRNISLIGSLSLTVIANVGSLLVPREALAAALRSTVGF